MSFTLKYACSAWIARMRSVLFTVLAIGFVSVLGMAPEPVFARENDQAESTNCPCKAQRRIFRPITEPTPIRKKDRERVRRILM